MSEAPLYGETKSGFEAFGGCFELKGLRFNASRWMHFWITLFIARFAWCSGGGFRGQGVYIQG
jgi:hypothetical protein